MRKSICLILILSIIAAVASGCATTSDKTRTQAEGAAVGAGVGAGSGALIGAIFGGTKGAARGAAIGAAIGGFFGLAYGTHVANKKEKYAKKEDWYDDCIKSAEKVNEEIKLYNKQLASELNELDSKTNQLASEYDQKKLKKSVLADEKKAVDSKLSEAEKNLKRAKFEVECQENVLADAKDNKETDYVSKLNNQIDSLKIQIAELETHTSRLASISQKMAV